jgi:hypothetical protein
MVSPPQSAASGDAGIWPWISLLLASGWALTGLLWWWSRRDRQPARVRLPASRRIDRAESELRQLRKACAARDDEACRRHLLAWGRALFGEDFHLAGAALERLPAELAEQTRRLDARLYGGETAAAVDHDIIAEQAGTLTRDQARRAKPGRETGGLAPLDPSARAA